MSTGLSRLFDVLNAACEACSATDGIGATVLGMPVTRMTYALWLFLSWGLLVSSLAVAGVRWYGSGI